MWGKKVHLNKLPGNDMLLVQEVHFEKHSGLNLCLSSVPSALTLPRGFLEVPHPNQILHVNKTLSDSFTC